MDLLNDKINTLLAITGKLADNPVAPLCYDSIALGSADDVGTPDGVASYNVASHQNIPLAIASILKVNETVLSKGYRSKASAITRMLLNHFFGRTSFNLNKLIAQLNSFFTFLKGSIVNPETTYGFASLDADGRVPYSQLPESAMEYEGNWNADTNTPTLVNGTGVNGEFYVVETGGTQNLGDSYTAVTPSGNENPQEEGWYVYDGNTYTATTDTAVDPDTTYYEKHEGTSITFLPNDRIIFNGKTKQWEKLSGGTVKSVGGVQPDSNTGNVPLGIINSSSTLNLPNNDGGLAVSVDNQKPDSNGNISLTVGGAHSSNGNYDLTIAGKSFTNGNFPMTVGGGSQQNDNDWRLRVNGKAFAGGDLSLYDTDVLNSREGLFNNFARYYGKQWHSTGEASALISDNVKIGDFLFTAKYADGLYVTDKTGETSQLSSLGSTSITGDVIHVAYLGHVNNKDVGLILTYKATGTGGSLIGCYRFYVNNSLEDISGIMVQWLDSSDFYMSVENPRELIVATNTYLERNVALVAEYLGESVMKINLSTMSGNFIYVYNFVGTSGSSSTPRVYCFSKLYIYSGIHALIGTNNGVYEEPVFNTTSINVSKTNSSTMSVKHIISSRELPYSNYASGYYLFISDTGIYKATQDGEPVEVNTSYTIYDMFVEGNCLYLLTKNTTDSSGLQIRRCFLNVETGELLNSTINSLSSALLTTGGITDGRIHKVRPDLYVIIYNRMGRTGRYDISVFTSSDLIKWEIGMFPSESRTRCAQLEGTGKNLGLTVFNGRLYLNYEDVYSGAEEAGFAVD